MGGVCSTSAAAEVVPVDDKGQVTTDAKVDGDYAFEVTDGLGDSENKPKDAEARRNSLNRCFDALDKDKSGTIDLKEFKQYLFKTGVTLLNLASGAQELMTKMDVNKDNMVCRDEFVTMMEAITVEKSDDDLEAWVAEIIYTATSKNVTGFGNSLGEILSHVDLTAEQLAKLKQCFSALDKDGSGFVEMTELKLYLSQTGVQLDELQSEEVSTLMSKLDKNADGKVSEQEFYVTLATVKKAVLTDHKFHELVDNILKACNGRQVDKPALAEVLLGKQESKQHKDAHEDDRQKEPEAENDRTQQKDSHRQDDTDQHARHHDGHPNAQKDSPDDDVQDPEQTLHEPDNHNDQQAKDKDVGEVSGGEQQAAADSEECQA